MSQINESEPLAQLAGISSLTWNYTTNLPETADVVLLVAGLFGIVPTPDKTLCQIGFVVREPSHTPMLRIFQKSSELGPFLIDDIKNQELSLMSGASGTKPAFFSTQKNSSNPVMRHQFDFNWMIDFERIFPQEINLKPTEFQPFLKVNDGVFCCIKSYSEFDIRRAGNSIEKRSLGLEILAGLSLDNSDATLRVAGQTFVLKKSEGPHLLVLTNLCDNDENDSGEYAKNFTIGEGEEAPIYSIRTSSSSGLGIKYPRDFPSFAKNGFFSSSENSNNLLQDIDKAKELFLEDIFSQDNVPCGAAGYGGGGGPF